MKIVTTGDANYFPGLCLTIASVQAFWTRPEPPRFLIITTHLPERMRRDLQEMAARHLAGSEVEVHAIDKDDLAALPPAPGLHQLTYARLMAARLVDEDRFLYLDSDLLILRDVDEIFSMELDGRIAAAPQAGRLGDDCPWCERDGLNPDDPYFCAGVMVIDRERWVRERVSERALELLHADVAVCRCLAQTVLNYVLHGRVEVISSAWSRVLWDLPQKIDEDTFILHYITGGKPLRAPSDAGAHGLWIEAFRRLCGKDFPLLAAKFEFLARRRIAEHAAAKAVVAALSTLARLGALPSAAKRMQAHWEWRRSATACPASRPEAGHCRRLAESLRLASNE